MRTWSTGCGSRGASAATADPSSASSARPAVDKPFRPVRPRWAASASAQPTWSARDPGRRGRSQATRRATDGTPVPAASTSPGGTSASTSRAIRRVSAEKMLDISGARALRVLPARSRVPTRPGRRLVASQAPARATHRSATGWAHQRSKASVGSHAWSPSSLGAEREQARGRGHLDEQGRRGLVDVQVAGRRLEIADAEPAAAQGHRRSNSPVVQQQLHAPYRLEGSAGGGPVDQRGGAFGRRDLRCHVDRVDRGPAAAQGQAHLPGQPGGAPGAHDEQASGEQFLGRGFGVVRRHGLPGRAGGRLATVLVDVPEQGQGGRS